jgi:hypothetical protein
MKWFCLLEANTGVALEGGDHEMVLFIRSQYWGGTSMYVN